MAFQTPRKQKYLAAGESVPFLIDGREMLVLWPEAAIRVPWQASTHTQVSRWSTTPTSTAGCSMAATAREVQPAA